MERVATVEAGTTLLSVIEEMSFGHRLLSTLQMLNRKAKNFESRHVKVS